MVNAFLFKSYQGTKSFSEKIESVWYCPCFTLMGQLPRLRCFWFVSGENLTPWRLHERGGLTCGTLCDASTTRRSFVALVSVVGLRATPQNNRCFFIWDGFTAWYGNVHAVQLNSMPRSAHYVLIFRLMTRVLSCKYSWELGQSLKLRITVSVYVRVWLFLSGWTSLTDTTALQIKYKQSSNTFSPSHMNLYNEWRSYSFDSNITISIILLRHSYSSIISNKVLSTTHFYKFKDPSDCIIEILVGADFATCLFSFQDPSKDFNFKF